MIVCLFLPSLFIPMAFILGMGDSLWIPSWFAFIFTNLVFFFICFPFSYVIDWNIYFEYKMFFVFLYSIFIPICLFLNRDRILIGVCEHIKSWFLFHKFSNLPPPPIFIIHLFCIPTPLLWIFLFILLSFLLYFFFFYSLFLLTPFVSFFVFRHFHLLC